MGSSLMQLIALAFMVATSLCCVNARGGARAAQVAYTNGDAIKRGLPLLKPRGRFASHTESALRKRQSPVITQKVLNFDDLPEADGNLPNVPASYQGLTWSANSVYYSEDGPYLPESPPNALFYASDFNLLPSFSAPAGGLMRIQSMYCRRGRSDVLTQNLIMIGKVNDVTIWTETVDCGTCWDCAALPVLNTWTNLPLVDTITFEGTDSGRTTGLLDNIALTMVV